MITRLITILMLATSLIEAQPSQHATYKRPDAISLSGQWQICLVKPLKEVLTARTGTFDPPTASTEVLDAIPASALGDPYGTLPPEARWQPVSVPDAWELVAGIEYNDAGWYRKNITIPKTWLTPGSHLWIEFDAVATLAGAWLNGRWLGGHSGDFVRWRVEATKAARAGQNKLLVYVDELPGHLMQGFLCAVAPHYGGIWQDVRLYRTGTVSLETDAIRVQADPLTGRVTVRVESSNRPASVRPRVTLHRYDPAAGESVPSRIVRGSAISASQVARDSSGWTYSATIPSHSLWSPEHPSLYLVEVALSSSGILEHLYQTFGFRSVRIQGSTLLLNGSPLYLRSILTWGQYPRRVAPLPTPEVVRREFAYLRSLGFNAQTACLIVLPDFYYDIADEMGFLIWQEYPTWHNEFLSAHLPMYHAMFPPLMRRDRNHPSVTLRSISVEAGVKGKGVMAELVKMARTMTDTPIQDNGSWIWLSDLANTDWYGENNYWNNDQWARYYLQRFPSQLDSLPPKPFIPSETVAGTVWPNLEAFKKVRADTPLPCGLCGTDDARRGQQQPYWFPAAYQACLQVERRLRERYAPFLPASADIVRDYLLPQSRSYALAFRRFQSQLLRADSRYAGFTMFLARNTPTVQCGLIDDTGAELYTPEQWSWFSDRTTSPVSVERTRHLPRNVSLPDSMPELQLWDPAWSGPTSATASVLYTEGGYGDLAPVFQSWPGATMIKEDAVPSMESRPEKPIIATTALTRGMVSYMENGGAVFVFTHQFPGGLGSEQKMFWGAAVFAPPVGVFDDRETERLLKLHQFDLTCNLSQAIPTGVMGIDSVVDPILRLYELHGLDTVITSDIVFASRCGKGILVATALDHRTRGGQWALAKLVDWASKWRAGSPERWRAGRQQAFPVTAIPPDSLRVLSVERSGSVVSLLVDWRFALDPERRGEDLRWYQPALNDTAWAVLQAAATWESQGFNYDGMAWYRRRFAIPTTAQGRRIVLVSEGINDGYNIWINGRFVATYGSFADPAKNSYQTKTETDITSFITIGGSNTIALQIVDISGVGGIGRPIYVLIE
jgi:hypothetical protein